MLYATKELDLPKITVTAQYNLHPWETDNPDEQLRLSLDSLGILHPPIVQEREDGDYLLLAGRKRIHYARQHAISPITCHVFPPTTGSDEILRIIYSEQSLCRALSLAERARLLEMYMSLTGAKSPSAAWLSSYELPVKPQQYSRLLDLLKEPITIIQVVHSGFIGDKMVWDLLALDRPADRIAFIELFLLLKMGGNKQRKFFKMIIDIALRNSLSVSEYLNSKPVREIVRNNQLNTPQTVQHLGIALQNALTPQFSAAQKIFNEQIHSLNLPEGCEITPSTSFEKDVVSLTIPFANIEDLKDKMELIRAVTRKSAN